MYILEILVIMHANNHIHISINHNDVTPSPESSGFELSCLC